MEQSEIYGLTTTGLWSECVGWSAEVSRCLRCVMFSSAGEPYRELSVRGSPALLVHRWFLSEHQVSRWQHSPRPAARLVLSAKRPHQSPGANPSSRLSFWTLTFDLTHSVGLCKRTWEKSAVFQSTTELI